jgi:hypothetical protein
VNGAPKLQEVGEIKNWRMGLLGERQRFLFFILAKKESLPAVSRLCGLPAAGRLCASPILFSQSGKDAKRNPTNFAALRLCEPIFFTHQERKPTYRRHSLRFCNTIFLFSQRRKEERVGANLKYHLLKEKMLSKGSPQLWLPLSF